MQQHANSNSVMESRNHSKNGASLKSQTSKRYCLFIIFALMLNIFVFNSCSEDDNNNNGEPYTPLAAPTGVTAVKEGDKIKISWNAVSGASRYEIQRSNSDTGDFSDLSGYYYVYDTYCYDYYPYPNKNYYRVMADSDRDWSDWSNVAYCNFSTGATTKSQNVYVGVVAFNSKISTHPISNNLAGAQEFIDSKTNDVDRTALCYAVSKSVTLFNASGLPAFDKIFVVSFTDGFDNGSSSLYVTDGKQVAQAQVYDQARTDLLAKTGMNSYAIGFGSEVASHANDMKKLVVGSGEYKTANSSSLNSTFQEIANSVLAASKNVVLRTQDGLYTEEYPKYFRLTVTAKSSSSSYTENSSVVCKLVGKTLSIVIPSNYVTFTAPVTGTLNSTDSKIVLPLNNLKYVRNSTEYVIQSIKVEVSFDNGKTYYEDVEDSSTSEDIAKKIGIVLVIDCSTSLGKDFPSVQSSANNFINTLDSSN